MDRDIISFINRPSVSLLELLLVVTIIGIVAAFAIPGYHRAIEKSRGRHAEFNLVAIYNAQKSYKLDNSEYYVCAPGCTKELILQMLEVDADDLYFTYSIADVGSGFTATATRVSGEFCSGDTMVVNQDESQPIKGCGVW